MRPTEQVGVDFLQLVRYGLRTPDDPLIRNTIKLVDDLLKVELPQGPCWYRYTSDGNGEHADGQVYDGSGHPVDRPEPVWARYHGIRPDPEVWFWSPQAPLRKLPAHKRLGFCLPLTATIHWRIDEQAGQVLATRALAMGVHIAQLPELESTHSQITFRLEGKDLATEEHCVKLISAENP